MYEVLHYYKEDIENSKILEKLNLQPNDFFVVSSHREENIDSDKNFMKLVDALTKLVQQFKKRIIVSTHPRTRKRIETLGISFPKEVKFKM
jgi:UDP-N-acetylglucosamine 2-epimerase (non-hydrolysing)